MVPDYRTEEIMEQHNKNNLSRNRNEVLLYNYILSVKENPGFQRL